MCSTVAFIAAQNYAQIHLKTCEAMHAGPHLLDLPLDILRAIAGHLSLKEWARGPSLVCTAVNELSMPDVAVKVRCLPVSYARMCMIR